MTPQRLFLIDAHALCYRAFFAIKVLNNSKGQATNAVFGFIKILQKILRDYEPSHIAVCFDTPKKTLRQEKFTEYKIQRPKMPDDLISQIPWIKELVKAYNMTILECDGYEADDCIAAVIKKLRKEDIEIVIVSDDKDLCQLVGEHVKVYHSRMDKILGTQDVKDRLGVDPHLIPDFLGLSGDSVDNIPGVKGIGEVTAKGLVNDFGSLEDIYKNLENIKSEKVREKLIAQKDQAFLSKDLTLLMDNVPIKFELDDLHQQSFNQKRLMEIYRELDFRKLAEDLSVENSVNAENVKINLIVEQKDVVSFLEKAKTIGQFSFIFEKSDEGQIKGLILGCGKDVYRIDIAQIKLCQSLFNQKNLIQVTYNYKEMKKTSLALGIELHGNYFDCLLAGYLLSPTQGSFSIPSLVYKYLNENVSNAASNAEVVQKLELLYAPISKELAAKSLEKLYHELELPLSDVLARMEMEGVSINLALLKELSAGCQSKIDEILKSIYKLADMEFNLNSPKQLSQVLFEKLKLPVVKKTKTGFSTDEEVLNKLASRHELPAFILEYRQIAKLKSTYIDALPQLVHPQSNRIHAYFHQTGAETGRLSSSNPNLQNIPIRSDLGKQIRKAFVASDKNHILLSADYSQIELRILAHLSKDEGLSQAFRDNQDIHRFTAAQVLDIPENQVDDKMRDSAKRVNFGIIYGMSAFGLAKDLNIPNTEAQDFIDRYFLRYPKVKMFMDETIARAEKDGFVVTLLNRRRYIPEITSPNMGLRQFAQRQAINTPVQGSAADLMKLAMIAIDQEIISQKLQSKMIITVHDELVFDVPSDEQAVMVKLIRQHMEHALELSVPIQVSIKFGNNWLEMEKIKK